MSSGTTGAVGVQALDVPRSHSKPPSLVMHRRSMRRSCCSYVTSVVEPTTAPVTVKPRGSTSVGATLAK